jgi:WD40 repeat protein
VLNLKRYDTRSDAIHSFGLSDNVNSISWFHANSNQLVSGMSGRCLRIFDLRCNYSNKYDITILECIINYKFIRIH